MIFAHGPAGFLIAKVTSKTQLFAKLTTWKLFAIGFLGGIFPDIDLFYYYLVDATESHRTFLTHAPLPYLILLLLAALFYKATKQPKTLYAVVFSFGALSHLVTDSLSSKLGWLQPFSEKLYGAADLGISTLNNNLFFANFLMEGIIFFFFFYVLIWMYTRTRKIRLVLTGVLGAVFVAGVATLTILNTHIFHKPYDAHLGDYDSDGLENFRDYDIDGDGIENIIDKDIDGDGETNVYQLLLLIDDQNQLWYDPTHGGFLQIPVRLGAVTNNNIVDKLYSGIGIHLRAEMERDYAKNSQGYVLPPQHDEFDMNNTNIRAWAEHLGWLEGGAQIENGRNQIGDILFFENDFIAVISGFLSTGETVALDVHPDRPVQERVVDDIIADEGKVLYRAKMLDASSLLSGQERTTVLPAQEEQ